MKTNFTKTKVALVLATSALLSTPTLSVAGACTTTASANSSCTSYIFLNKGNYRLNYTVYDIGRSDKGLPQPSKIPSTFNVIRPKPLPVILSTINVTGPSGSAMLNGIVIESSHTVIYKKQNYQSRVLASLIATRI